MNIYNVKKSFQEVLVSIAIIEALKNKWSYCPIKFVSYVKPTQKAFNIMGFNIEEFEPKIKAVSSHNFKYT